MHAGVVGIPGFGAMDVTKPDKFIGFGAMEVTKPYDFIGFGAMEVTKPYKFIGFGHPPRLRKSPNPQDHSIQLGWSGPLFPTEFGGCQAVRAGLKTQHTLYVLRMVSCV